LEQLTKDLQPVWQENTDEEAYLKVIKQSILAKNGSKDVKKTSGNNAESTNIEFSCNLVKVLERRYPLASSDARSENEDAEKLPADAQ